MSKMSYDPNDFAELFESIGPRGVATQYGIEVRNIYRLRRRVETELGRRLFPPDHTEKGETARGIRALQEVGFEAKEMINLSVKDGIVMVASDCHYWPGMRSTAHAGFVKLCKELKPQAIIMNGDVLDGSTISRFPPPGWE